MVGNPGSKDRSQSLRLVGGILFLNLFVYAVVGFALHQDRALYRSRAAETVENLAGTLERSVAGVLGRFDVALFALSEDLRQQLASGGLDQEALGPHFARHRSFLTEAEAVWFAAPRGGVLLEAKGRDGERRKPRDLELPVHVWQGTAPALVLSRPVYLGDHWSVVLARPVSGPDGTVAGVVCASIPLERFATLFASVHVGSRGFVSLRDEELRLVVRVPVYQGERGAVGNQIVSPQAFERTKAHPEGGSYETLTAVDGIGRMVAYRRVEHVPLFLFVGQATADFLAPWWRELTGYGLLLAFFTLVTIFAARALLRADSALRESEFFFRESQRAAAIGSYRLDVPKGVWRSSEILDQIFGIDPGHPKTVAGWISLVHPGDRDMMLRHLNEEVLAARRSFHKEYRIVRPSDGATRWVLGLGELELDARGQPVSMAGTIQDFTEQRLAAQAVEESEAKYRFLFENAAAGMFRSRLDGTAILDVNERFLKMMGYAREELVGTPPGPIWANVADRARMVEQLQARGTLTDLESVFRTKTGEERTCLLSVRLSRDSGIVEGSVVDVTDRKRTEEALARAQKIESLGTLAGGIAHDFNNLLTGILGNVSMSREEVSAAERGEMLEEAEAATRRAQHLTRQLLTFSRGGAPVKVALELGSVTREAARFATRGASCECRVEVAPDLWPVEADAGQMGQVIQNLVLNAAEATPGGGTIEITVENQQRTERAGPLPPGPYVRLRVSDRGVGIPEELLSRIFDPFFSTKGRGSGLGLSVAHSIVLRHGGHIEARSRAGQGSTFEVLLPARPEAVVNGDPVLAPVERVEARVLVMDDEDMVRRAAARVLATIGCEVSLAAHGDEAIELFSRAREEGRPFDLVILDLTVPGGMGGVPTLRRLREQDPEVRAIASSGYASDPVMADCQQFGFDRAIAKPWGAGELRVAVKAVASRPASPVA